MSDRFAIDLYHLPDVTDDVQPGGAAAATTYRGFLFADMRGFTAFAERHGNAAAAEMVASFLDIARAAIARHDGAELKTEGDNIHAVFPSASGAVLCGLEIVEGAAELNARQPDRQLGLGIGIHAGEAIETAQGYIGRAVNIAARLCAIARPGEVLVSSTVKGITQASITVGFIPRGRRQLKGIADPILVYAVTRDPSATAPRELHWAVLGTGGGVLAVVAAALIVALAGSLVAGNRKATPGASAAPAPSAQPVAMGPLGVGAYVPQQFQPPFSFRIEDLGWTASRDSSEALALIREDAPRGSVYFARVQHVIANPCGEDVDGAAGPVADVIETLRPLGHVQLTDEKPAEVGGFAARQVDVTIADGAQAACGGIVGADIPVFVLGDETWQASAGERFRLFSFDIDDQEVTVLVSIDWTKTHSVQELEDMFRLGDGLLGTVEF